MAAKKRLPADAFSLAMFEAALFSSNDESDESGGVPLDQNYGFEDIATPTWNGLIKEAREFQRENADDIAAGTVRGRYDPEVQAGHDFWLTRNGHGAGFWDGDWPEGAEDRLTDSSRRFGEVNLYVHRGRIYAAGFER